MINNPTLSFLTICFIIASCGNDQTTAKEVTDTLKNTADTAVTRELQASDNSQYDRQVEIVKQMVWENLRKVPGTDRDYVSEVKLRIGNGNLLDADAKLIFPKSSWLIASILVDDYKDVLKKTNTNVFAVIYKMISDPDILATEITFTGLWRPWLGSHVHPEGRGIDIGDVKGKEGRGVIFNYNTSRAENAYGATIRQKLTTNFPILNQYLSPWYMCNPIPTCIANNGATPVERVHRDHLHLTLVR